MLKIDFHKYTVKDFLLLDESFRRWAGQEDPDTATQFDNWLEEHPENGAILEARTIVLRLKSHFDDDASPNEIEEVWSKIQNSIDNTLVKHDYKM